MDDATRVLGARDLGGGADCEADAVAAEEGGRGARVAAQVEVDVRAELVRAGQAVLGAERVTIGRAEVVNYIMGSCVVSMDEVKEKREGSMKMEG